MGIYIKEMEKPIDCVWCDFYRQGYCHIKHARVETKKGVDANCPLIEVKAPHGRLIDEDAFSGKWNGNHIGEEDEYRYHDAQWIYRDDVDKVPTVIEAEVE